VTLLAPGRRFYFAVWFLVLVVVFSLQGKSLLHYYNLLRTGHRSTGRITESHPESHRTIRYEYDADGRGYTGVSEGHSGRVGESIEVWFLPSDPETVCAGDPRDHLLNELTFTLFMALVFPTLTILILRARLKGPSVTTR
jgi:hypothetical protein